MKKILIPVFAIIVGFTFYNFNTPVIKNSNQYNSLDSIPMPENVNTIVQHSCYGCHNSKSKNEKAKDKFQFDELHSLSTFKVVGKMSDVQKELNKNKMPPKKFLEKYPDRALSDEDKTTLLNWAKETSDNLTGK